MLRQKARATNTRVKPLRTFPLWLWLVALVLAAPLLLVLKWQVAPPAPVGLDLGDTGTSASHFFGVEQGGGRSFRWSRDLSAISLPALSANQAISLTLDPARPPGAPLPKVTLLVGDRVMDSFTPQPGRRTYSFNLGPGLSPDVRLIISSETFTPGAGDSRRLGVALFEATTVPAPNRIGLVLPPLLWLLLSSVWPLLLYSLARQARQERSIAAVSAGFGALLPALWSLLASAQVALPGFAWGSLLVGAIVTVFMLRRVLQPGGAVAARLRSVGASRWELPVVGVLSLVGAGAMMWPLLPRLWSSLPGWPGDNFAFLYKIWWFRASLFERHQSPFFDPGSYAPFGFNLGQGEPTLLNTLPGSVIGELANLASTYNVLALLSFLVAAVGGYLVVREISSSRLAGLLGAAAFAFCPYRMSQFAGHLQMLGTGWIALSFFFAERLLKRDAWRQGAYMGAALGLAALSAWYYAYMVGLGLGVYLVLRLFNLRRSLRPRPLVLGLVAGGIVFLALASPVAVPSLQLWAQGGLTHSAKASDEHSAAPLDYVVPNPLHPVWGQIGMQAHAEQNVIESALYVGLPVALIALAGFFAYRRRAKEQAGGSWGAWLGLGIVCFVLSLGLTLHDANGQVHVNGSAVSLPGQLLYDWLPLYSSMRAFARFGVLVELALVVLMGIGWAALLKWGPPFFRERPYWATLVAALLILVDFWTGPYPWGTTQVRADDLDRYLASAPAGIVMHMPLASSQSGPALYRHVYYNKPIAYGYETFEPPQWRAARPDLEAFPSDKSLDVLKGWGVRYVVVSANAYGANWPGQLAYLQSLPRLHFVQSFHEPPIWNVDPQVLDTRPDMEEYATPDAPALFEIVR